MTVTSSEQRSAPRPAPSFLSGVRYEHLLAGVSGGVISTCILHPLDLLKIRFEFNVFTFEYQPPASGLRFAVNEDQWRLSRSSRPSYLPTAVSIVRGEGVRGLYQGLTPNVVGAGSAWGFYFLFYNAFKSSLQGGNTRRQLTAGHHLAAASASGVVTLTLTNPVWVVKTRLCLQSQAGQYSGFTDALLKIGRQEGVRGLYSGFVPGLFGVSHGAVQFVAYEEMKNRYHNYRRQEITTKLGTAEYLTFAALSKLLAAFITYPYQVVRTRLQNTESKYSGSLDCIRKIMTLEGAIGFYKGLTPNLVRVVPATMITFVVYENLSHYLLKREDSEKVVGIVSLVESDEKKS